MSPYPIQSDFSLSGGIPKPPYSLHKSVLPRIDPEYSNFFDKHLSSNSNILYTHRTPLKVIREGGNVMPGQSPLSPVSRIYDIQISRTVSEGPDIPARVFHPRGDKPADGWPLFIWFHGGGWVLGNMDTENSYCTKVCSKVNCVVLSIDYRLAPENPFPAAVHDAYEALLYGMKKAVHDLDVNNYKVAIGGSSAGGNLAAVIAHKYSSDEAMFGMPFISLQLLVVPVTDNTATGDTQPSWRENEFTPQLPAEKMYWYRQLYLPNIEDREKPEASPLFYPDESFSKTVPCFIAAASCDVLRSEAEAYHIKLKNNGVKSDIVIYPGVPHPVMAMDQVLTKGKQLIEDTTKAIKESFE